MKNVAKNKIINIFLSFLVVLVSMFLAPATAIAQEVPAETTTTTSTDTINWKDPNNWYQQWLAGQQAKEEAAAAAAAAAATNTNTGADSYNQSTTDTTTQNQTDINNDAQITGVVNGSSDTGDSSADNNTGDGSVSSGDSTLIGNLSTDANNVTVDTVGGCAITTGCGTVSMSDLLAENDKTGAGSYNISENNNTSENDLDIENDVDLYYLVNFAGSTGDNSADKNTGDGYVTTGDSDVVLTAINTANNVNVGTAVFNVMDDQTGDIVIDFDTITPTYLPGGSTLAGNNQTGADSYNSATNNTDTGSTILIDNFGNLVNNYNVTSNSGDNTAEKNTGDGSITSGDANLSFNLINFLNNAFLGGNGELLLGIVNIFGDLSGDILLQGINDGSGNTGSINPDIFAGNNTTGYGSDNQSTNTIGSDTNIDLNNLAFVENNVNLNADTGSNDASKNTGGGTINTGDVDSNLNLATIANTASVGSGGDIWMVLINNMGSWTGQLFGGTQGSAYSPFFTFTVNPDGTIVAANDTTGAGSVNQAANNSSNNTDIAVNNSGTLVNNIYLNANTGGNSASYNTGSGSITTGDVNVAANIANILNNTFIGGRFLLTIVNIFGSFSGDIINGEKTLTNTGLGTPLQKPTSNTVSTTQGQIIYASNSGGTLFETGGTNTKSDQTKESNKEKSKTALVLSAQSPSEGLPISRFNGDRGIFDGFEAWYLLLPVIFGTFISLSRKLLLKDKEVSI